MKEPNALKTIGEVSKVLNIPSYVLRFWEKKFLNVSPIQKKNGRRYYSNNDFLLLKKIKELLYEKHYSIRGAQKVLNNNQSDENDRYLLIEELKAIQRKVQKFL